MVKHVSYSEGTYGNAAACEAAIREQAAYGWRVSEVSKARGGRLRVLFRKDSPDTAPTTRDAQFARATRAECGKSAEISAHIRPCAKAGNRFGGARRI